MRDSKTRPAGSSVQRSFRISTSTMDLLDARAAALSETRNALVERLLAEGLRTDRHPLVSFRGGTDGARRPGLVGTRLSVVQVVETLRASGNELGEAARYLGLPERHVRAAISYYADFQDEVDELAARDRDVERRELERVERAQRVLG